MKLKRVCYTCGKEFERDVKHVNRAKKLGRTKEFCSRECLCKGNVTSIKSYCSHCGKEIWIRPSQEVKSRSGNHFCSKSCASSFNNKGNTYNLKHGMGSYRRRAIQHYGAKCRICGYSVLRVLEVHHKDGNRMNNAIRNLDVLCPTCHVEYEVGIRRYQRLKSAGVAQSGRRS